MCNYEFIEVVFWGIGILLFISIMLYLKGARTVEIKIKGV